MKIASSGKNFDKSLAKGDLTQLEWLSLCASSLALDGVVFDTRYFPRTDDEYLAQLKKTAIDLGLTIAAVATDDPLTLEGTVWIERAARLGAPLVITRTPSSSDTFTAWNQAATALQHISSSAKHANVVVALRNTPETLCASASDLNRLSKDIDSSWIRYALDPSKLPPDDTLETALARTVIICNDITSTDKHDRRFMQALRTFRGFFLIDAIDDQGSEDALARLIKDMRQAAFEAAKA
jgi:hypothetical protein